jgi:hypothetical protein
VLPMRTAGRATAFLLAALVLMGRGRS